MLKLTSIATVHKELCFQPSPHIAVCYIIITILANKLSDLSFILLNIIFIPAIFSPYHTPRILIAKHFQKPENNQYLSLCPLIVLGFVCRFNGDGMR